MTDVVLFHHAQGCTDGVRALGERLRAAGHRVAVPDLYEGRTFDDLEAGVDHAREVGFDEVVRRGVAAAADLPAEAVYVGISLGVLPAETLAVTRPGARGAVLVSGAVPPEEVGGAWPAGLPLQVHTRAGDELGDADVGRALTDAVQGAELFLYEGDEHLFVDETLPTYDAAATDLLVERLLALLARVG